MLDRKALNRYRAKRLQYFDCSLIASSLAALLDLTPSYFGQVVGSPKVHRLIFRCFLKSLWLVLLLASRVGFLSGETLGAAVVANREVGGL